jgi:hypothetical protein
METHRYGLYSTQKVEIFNDIDVIGDLDLRKVQNITPENGCIQNRCEACKCGLKILCFVAVLGGLTAIAYFTRFPFNDHN